MGLFVVVSFTETANSFINPFFKTLKLKLTGQWFNSFFQFVLIRSFIFSCFNCMNNIMIAKALKNLKNKDYVLIIYFFYIVLEIKRIPYKKYSLFLSSFVGPHECRVPLPYTVTISLGYPSTIWGKITKFEIENIRNKVIGERQQTTSMF